MSDELVMIVTDWRAAKKGRISDKDAIAQLLRTRAVDAPRLRLHPWHRVVPARDVVLAVLVAALHVRRASHADQ